MISDESVREHQLSGIPARMLHVRNTVARQIVAATVHVAALSNDRERLLKAFSPTDLQNARSYLRRVSTLPLSPAIATFAGMISSPYNLYKVVSLDRLHSLDLGVSWLFPDNLIIVLSKPEYNQGVIKAVLVLLANMRLTRFARREGIYQTPYRTRAKVAHSNMTGSIRRTLIPFMWPSLLVLRSQCSSDEDIVLQAALLLNELQIRLR